MNEDDPNIALMQGVLGAFGPNSRMEGTGRSRYTYHLGLEQQRSVLSTAYPVKSAQRQILLYLLQLHSLPLHLPAISFELYCANQNDIPGP